MEEIISTTISNTLNSFDIPFCIAVNIATYLIIKTATEIKPTVKISTWQKRLILVIVSLILGAGYYLDGTSGKILLNSIILAPVSWSWILKPICKKLDIDYTTKRNRK